MRLIFAIAGLFLWLPLAAQQPDAVRQLQKFTQVYRYLDGLYVLRRQEQAEILESIGRVAQKESALTAGRVADHISQLLQALLRLKQLHSRITGLVDYLASYKLGLFIVSADLESSLRKS